MDQQKIQAEYERMHEFFRAREVNPDLLEQISEWRSGKWETYRDYVLKRIPVSLRGKTVADFGCRYGLLFPLLFELGATKVIGIEDLDLYLQHGRELFAGDGERVEFAKSEHGYVPLQPETVDLAVMNEVISHIQPTYLPTIYEEISRILKPGGVLFISDGNNLGHPSYFRGRLVPLYDAIENGPDGARVGDVSVQVCLLNQRKKLIRERHREMSAADVDNLAKNTSGLFGAHLIAVIDRFAQTRELIRRPYRRGKAPVYPDSGQVEERGFYPEGVVFDLTPFGFECHILDRPSRPPLAGRRLFLESSKIMPAQGYGRCAFEVAMPAEYPDEVSALLLENDRPLPIPCDDHAEIGEKGMGRYSMWRANRTIYFSSSDNSDPRRNRRKYVLFWTTWEDDRIAYPSANFQIVAIKRS